MCIDGELANNPLCEGEKRGTGDILYVGEWAANPVGVPQSGNWVRESNGTDLYRFWT